MQLRSTAICHCCILSSATRRLGNLPVWWFIRCWICALLMTGWLIAFLLQSCKLSNFASICVWLELAHNIKIKKKKKKKTLTPKMDVQQSHNIGQFLIIMVLAKHLIITDFTHIAQHSRRTLQLWRSEHLTESVLRLPASLSSAIHLI